MRMMSEIISLPFYDIRWMKKNPWFEEEVLPELKLIVKNIIKKENE